MNTHALNDIKTGLFEAIATVRKSFVPAVLFEAAINIIGAIIITPLSAFLFARLVRLSGFSAVNNLQVLSFFFSLPGILSMTLAAMALFIGLFIKEAGQLAILSSAHYGVPISFRYLVNRSVFMLPKLLRMGVVEFSAYFLLIFPLIWLLVTLVGEGAFFSLGWPAVTQWMTGSWWRIALVSIGIGGLIYGMIRFFVNRIFLIPCAVLENLSFPEAVRRSICLVKGSFFRILFLLSLWFIIFLLTVVGVASLIVEMIGIGIGDIHPENPVFFSFFVLVIVIGVVASVIVSLVLNPINTAFIFHLYLRHRKRKEGAEPKIILPKISRQTGQTPWIHKHPKLAATGFFAGVLAVAFLFFLGLQEEAPLLKDHVEVTAHRGSSLRAPENTLSAILLAAKEGADYAEMDVRQTADDVVVLLHDESLWARTGVHQRIWSITYPEVRQLDAGIRFSPDFAGERIVSLEEVIQQTVGKIKLNIEIKAHPQNPHIASAVVSLIEQYGIVHQCVITSLDYRTLQRVRRLNPDIRIGLITALSIGTLWDLDVDFYSIIHTMATPEFLHRADSIGRSVHVWTVNDRDEMERLIRLGVDNIITDDPLVFFSIMKEKTGIPDLGFSWEPYLD